MVTSIVILKISVSVNSNFSNFFSWNCLRKPYCIARDPNKKHNDKYYCNHSLMCECFEIIVIIIIFSFLVYMYMCIYIVTNNQFWNEL